MTRDEMPDVGLVFGLSVSVDGLEDLRAGLVQARYAAKSAIDGRAGPVSDWTNITSHQALIEMQPREVLRNFADAVLGPLVAADARRNSELLMTLRTFFAAGQRTTACAEALHVHPNTLRHRLTRIEALTNRSLDNTGDQVDLFLALVAASVHAAAQDSVPGQ
jgi:DNA-binding PucR family transcriptional regulator